MSTQVAEIGTLCVECNDHAWSPSLCDDYGHENWALVDDVLWSEQDTAVYGWPVQCSVCDEQISATDIKYAVGLVWV